MSDKTKKEIFNENSQYDERIDCQFADWQDCESSMDEWADQEKRKEVSAFLLWLDLSDWVFMAGTNEFEHVITGNVKPYDFVYDLYLQSLPKTV